MSNMHSRTPIQLPGLPLAGGLDAPPSDLIEQWLPDLVDEYRAMIAALSASLAAARALGESTAPMNQIDGGGPAWSKAVAADVTAVREGKKPGALARLIAGEPARYGVAHACALHAHSLVSAWNRGAASRVGRESVQRIDDAEDMLRGEVESVAGRALSAADETRSTDTMRRLGAAWDALTDMDALLKSWREVYSVQGWVYGDRTTGQAVWQPPGPDLRPDGEVIAQAVALRDEKVRTQLANRRRAPERV